MPELGNTDLFLDMFREALAERHALEVRYISIWRIERIGDTGTFETEYSVAEVTQTRTVLITMEVL